MGINPTGFLYTDHYQLTMAQLYWKQGMVDRPAQFDYFFRSYPDYGDHQAGYCIAAGVDELALWMEQTRPTSDDLEGLAGLSDGVGRALFDAGFLAWLGASEGFASLTVSAVPEGRVVHPNAPTAIVTGPLAAAQILETALINHLAYPTLVATKASRMSEAARQQPILEFGLRRAPGTGAVAGSHAALVGGASFSSNVSASLIGGTPPKGTHGHSMIQAFLAMGASEVDAFRAYASEFPDDCTLLVDTISTLESGVPNAITVFEELRKKGHRPAAIRLDSGDLAYLAIRSSELLDAAGFTEVGIVLSSGLDELAIWQILAQIDEEARQYGLDPRSIITRLSFGVGSKMIASEGAPVLDGVYKLVALDTDDGWRPAIKLSETSAKVPTPGRKRVWRFYDRRGLATADVLATPAERFSSEGQIVLHNPNRPGASRTLDPGEVTEAEELLEPCFSEGRRFSDGSLEESRARRRADLERLDPGVRRLINPHIYHVSISTEMLALRSEAVESLRPSG